MIEYQWGGYSVFPFKGETKKFTIKKEKGQWYIAGPVLPFADPAYTDWGWSRYLAICDTYDEVSQVCAVFKEDIILDAVIRG